MGYSKCLIFVRFNCFLLILFYSSGELLGRGVEGGKEFSFFIFRVFYIYDFFEYFLYLYDVFVIRILFWFLSLFGDIFLCWGDGSGGFGGDGLGRGKRGF